MVEFRWLGVAGFELKWNGSILLVDPFLTRPPAYKLLFGRTHPDGALLRQHIPHADHILISHAHYDHLLDAAEIAGYSGGRVYGSENTCRIAEVCGLAAAQVAGVRAGEELTLTPGTYPQPLPPGQGVNSPPCRGKLEGARPSLPPIRGKLEGRHPSLPPIRGKLEGVRSSLPPIRGEPEGGKREPIFHVTVLAGEHTPVPVFGPGELQKRLVYPLRLRDFVMDEDFTFLIQAGDTRVLAWHHWRPGPAPRADVLVIGADIRLADLAELIDQVQPRLLIPTHWDNFLRPLTKPLKPFFRPPCPGHPLPERYDPWKVKRYVARVRPGVGVWVPNLMEKIEI